MVTSLVNLFSTVLSPLTAKPVAPKALPVTTSNNPFANPFLSSEKSSYDFYGKNSPVKGGYFAGYYNGQPNIVGKRLFLEV